VLAPAELEALLRHEDRHRRRRDPLRLLLGRVAAVVFWFYPPLRWLLTRLHECSEYACDEAALEAGLRTEDYLRALARAIRRGLDPAPPVAAAASGGPRLLRRRLARLRRKERPTMKLGRLILVAAAVVVGAAVFVPLDLVAEDAPPPPPPPPPAEVPERVPPAEPSPPAEPTPPARETEPVPPAEPGEETLVEPPRIIKMVEPKYPEKARQARVEGVVKIMVVVNVDGTVAKAVPVMEIEGYPELTKAAVKALQQCEFAPGTVDGEATKMKTKVKMEFELD